MVVINAKRAVAMESQWLLYQYTEWYGKSLGAKEVYGCN
jgi:hypothetical protein